MFKTLKNPALKSILKLRLSINLADSLFMIFALVLAQDRPIWLTSIMITISYIPEALLILWGPLIDRFKAYRLLKTLVVTQFLCICLFLIFLTYGQMSNGVLLFFYFLIVMTSSLTYPIEETVIPKIVAPNDLARANSLLSMTHSIADSLFNGVIGFLLLILTTQHLASLNTFLYLLPVFILRQNKQHILKIDHPTIHNTYHFRDYTNDFKQGLSEIISKKYLKIIAPLIVINFFVALNAVYYPHFVKLIANDYASLYAHFEMIKGIGSVIGAALVSYMIAKLSTVHSLFVSLLTYSLGITLAITSTNSILFIIYIGIAYVGFSAANIYLDTTFQKIIPQHILGRANTTITSLIVLSSPLGALLANALPFSSYPRIVMLIAPIIILCVSCYFLKAVDSD